MTTHHYLYNSKGEVTGLKDPSQVDWTLLSKEEQLSAQFMVEHFRSIDWKQASAHQRFTLPLLLRLKNQIHWKKLQENPHLDGNLSLMAQYKLDFKRLLKRERATLPLAFIDKYYWAWGKDNHYCWKCISADYRLTEAFVRKFRFLLHWPTIRKKQRHLFEDFLAEFYLFGLEEDHQGQPFPAFAQLSEEEVLNNLPYMHWRKLFMSQQFSETFLEKLLAQVKSTKSFIVHLSHYQILSDAFILKHQDRLDWFYLSFNPRKQLSITLIDQFSERDLHWYYISQYYPLPADIIEKYKWKGIHFPALARNTTGCLTEALMRKYWQYLDTPLIWQHQKLSELFIRDYIEEVNWDFLSRYHIPVLSEDFIEEFGDYIIWSRVQPKLLNPIYQVYDYAFLSEKIIRKFLPVLNWYKISAYAKVSEDFLEEFSENVHWPILFKYRFKELSEAFIAKHRHRLALEKEAKLYHLHPDAPVDAAHMEDFIRTFLENTPWENVFEARKGESFVQYSESFLREFAPRFNKKVWKLLAKSQRLSVSFCEDFQQQLDWKVISRHQKLSEAFIRTFQQKVDWKLIFKHQLLSPHFKKEFQHLVNS